MKYNALKTTEYLFNSTFSFTTDSAGNRQFLDSLKPCKIFVDPSTNTGISVYDKTGLLVFADYAQMIGDELVHYRRDLKALLTSVAGFFGADEVYFEEVYGGDNFETLKVLLSIRETFMELRADTKLKVHGINNKRWKAALGPRVAEDDKEHIRHYVSQMIDITGLSQDVIDAIGIGMAVMKKQADVVTLPARTKFDYKVYPVGSPEETADILRKRHGRQLATFGYNYFTYRTDRQLKENALHALCFDQFVITAIPDHRYLPQILLANGIRYAEVKDKYLLTVLSLKH